MVSWLRALRLGFAAFLAGVTISSAFAGDNLVRIGYQKYGTLILLKARGSLETRLASLGVKVSWTEFPGGPQLLEAVNVGAIDFGVTGEAPPVFAQAAGAPLLYVAYELPAPKGEAILVPKDSPIKTVADLKGKKIALNKGSNVHYLLVKALEKAGLSYSDVTVTYLTPADGRAAFQKGAVDAWVIWDPFLAAAEGALGARQLANGEGIVFNHQFYLATRKFTEANPQIVSAILDELRQIDQWLKADLKQAAAQLSASTGLPVPVIEVALARQTYGTRPIDDQVVKAQQDIADTFLALGLLPKPIKVSDAIWRAGS